VLTYLYLGALIFGGVLLGSSILLGGHDDLDADGDLDLDADADADVDLDGVDKDVGLDAGGGADVFFWLRSLRFYIFFLAFFGLTGLTLDGLGLVESEMLTLGLSLGMGLLTGVGAAATIRSLMNDELGSVATGDDYIGKSARILVPVKPGGVGKVRVRVGGTNVDVLAITDEDFGPEDEAIIIEMEGTRARIARVDPD